MRRLDRALEKVIKLLLISFIGSMLLLTISNIVLRYFGVNYMWIDPLVRHLVFSCAFLGGALATGKKNHIKIDVLSTLYAKKYPALFIRLELILSLISSAACFFMAYAGYNFFKVEAEFGKLVFWSIHSSWLISIIPIGFTLIALRFLTSLKIKEKPIGAL